MLYYISTHYRSGFLPPNIPLGTATVAANGDGGNSSYIHSFTPSQALSIAAYICL